MCLNVTICHRVVCIHAPYVVSDESITLCADKLHRPRCTIHERIYERVITHARVTNQHLFTVMQEFQLLYCVGVFNISFKNRSKQVTHMPVTTVLCVPGDRRLSSIIQITSLNGTNLFAHERLQAGRRQLLRKTYNISDKPGVYYESQTNQIGVIVAHAHTHLRAHARTYALVQHHCGRSELGGRGREGGWGDKTQETRKVCFSQIHNTTLYDTKDHTFQSN